MNLDPQELAKFDQMAHTWWDPEGDCKLLHQLNPVRLDFVNSRAPLAGRSVLDVGCGAGILSEAMVGYGATVTGIDASAKLIQVANLHALSTGLSVNYQVDTAESFALQCQEALFDCVTCMELIEHVPDPGSLLKACYDSLRPGGDLFISTLNRTPKAFLEAILGAEYLLRLLPTGTHRYTEFIRPSELAAWGRALGLSLKALKGFEYKLLEKRFRLSSTVEVNYIAHFKKTA